MKVFYLTILRPTQWLKNLMLFFPPMLAGHLQKPSLITEGVLPFCSFCLVSSAGYIVNDVLDWKRDQHHPQKKKRPLASGAISVRTALLYAVVLMFSGLLLGVSSAPRFVLFLVLYAAVSLLYSLVLKNIPVLDLFGISAGFLIRLQAGGALFSVPISPWLFVTVLLLSLFLSAGKRLSETMSLGEGAGEHRVSLAGYTSGFLAGAMYMTGGAAVVTYAMCVLHKPGLIYTVPLCLFGLLRYILRVIAGKGGDPTESLLKDRLLFVVGLVWLVTVVWSIYQ